MEKTSNLRKKTVGNRFVNNIFIHRGASEENGEVSRVRE